MKKTKEVQEKIIWIIRFADGTLASSYGTKERAREFAEAKKDLHGGDYVIN